MSFWRASFAQRIGELLERPRADSCRYVGRDVTGMDSTDWRWDGLTALKSDPMAPGTIARRCQITSLFYKSRVGASGLCSYGPRQLGEQKRDGKHHAFHN